MTEPDGVGSVFADRLRSGGQGPAMVVVPAGRFRMGWVSGLDCRYSEKPVHDVVIPQAFALSVHEVTFEDYDRFKRRNKVADNGWGRGWRPVINVSWDDAREYVAWLSSPDAGGVPAAERGGVGVRCPRGLPGEVQLGQRGRREQGEL